LAGCFVFLAPFPDNNANLLNRTASIARAHLGGRKSIAVFGNSVIDALSRCDRDRRTLLEMIADASSRHSIDLSYGGQTISEELNLSSAALRAPGIDELVVFISTTSLADYDAIDLRSALFFRLFGTPLFSNDFLARLSRGVGLTGVVHRFEPFEYKGRSYPDYDGVKNRYFVKERQYTACPERQGEDLGFIEAYYYRNLAEPNIWQQNVIDLSILAKDALDRRKRLVFVLSPINFGDMEALDPELAKAARRRRDQVLALADANNISIIDATEVAQADDFADRYCACGHLNERGRAALIDAIKEKI
jgi:hypothetical protein